MHCHNKKLSCFVLIATALGGSAYADQVRAQASPMRPGIGNDVVSLSPQPLPPKENATPLKRPGVNKEAAALSPQPLPPKERPLQVTRPRANKDATALSPQPLPPKELPAKPAP